MHQIQNLKKNSQHGKNTWETTRTLQKGGRKKVQKLNSLKLVTKFNFIIVLLFYSWNPIIAEVSLGLDNGVYITDTHFQDEGFSTSGINKILVLKGDSMTFYNFECTDEDCEEYFSIDHWKILRRYRKDRHWFEIKVGNQKSAHFIHQKEDGTLDLGSVNKKYFKESLESGELLGDFKYYRVPKSKLDSFKAQMKKWEKELGKKK